MFLGIWIGLSLGKEVHTLLGRKTSPESAEAWEEKEESRFEVDGTGDESHSWASEYFLCDISHCFTKPAILQWSICEERKGYQGKEHDISHCFTKPAILQWSICEERKGY